MIELHKVNKRYGDITALADVGGTIEGRLIGLWRVSVAEFATHK